MNWPAGTRVRLKVATIGGWRGTATMLERGTAVRDGSDDPFWGGVTAAPYEWARMRDQTANPGHAELVTRALISGIAERPSAELHGERRGFLRIAAGPPTAVPPSDPPSEG